MIIRIMGEGQYQVSEADLIRLNALDATLQSIADEGDRDGFGVTLDDLLAAVRKLGVQVPDDALTPSDLVLPAPGSSLDEVAALLGDEGLIPG